jgi:hypothetical protein
VSSWSERAVREVRPAEAVEHVLRYSAVAALVSAAPQWVDLGCGDGSAAAVAGVSARSALLVDRDPAEAARVLSGEPLALDLTAPAELASRVVAGAVVTCFSTLEHLDPWLPLVELLAALSDATVMLSVPNQAFAEEVAGPAIWGEGAFSELLRLLPADAVVARQVSLVGSALVVDGAEPPAVPSLSLDGLEQQPPSELLVAFGPGAASLVSVAAVAPADRRAERQRERERDAEVAVLSAQLRR